MVREGQTFLFPGMSDNKEYTITEVGEGSSTGLGSGPGEGEVELSPVPPGVDRVTEVEELREALDPTAINRRRSDEARTADTAKDAEITSDPLEWASAPDELDFPGVDTGPTFREAQGDNFDTDSFLDRR